MSGFLKFLGGVLFLAVIFGGWWLIDRGQEYLPGPVNAVIDGVQNGGMPQSGPIVRPLDDGASGDPLAGCPEFADDARDVEAAVVASATVSQEQADANYDLIGREANRIAGGGATRPLAESGVDAALIQQADSLDALVTALDGVAFRTPEAESLSTGLGAAAVRVAAAHRSFAQQGTPTRAQWQAWLDAVGGPMAQADAASKGFAKCPA